VRSNGAVNGLSQALDQKKTNSQVFAVSRTELLSHEFWEPMKRNYVVDPTLGDLEYFPATSGPQVRVALHLLAERRVRGVIFQASFKPADVLYLKFQYDPIELTGQVRQNAMPWNLGDCGCLLQLSREFACIPGFGDKAIADDQHESSSYKSIFFGNLLRVGGRK
jgi:hypothetical protein